MLWALLSLVVSLPASSQWQRVMMSGKGTVTDTPAPHPLRYFTANAFLRDDGNELCTRCTPEGKAESAGKYSIRSTAKPVGSLAGYSVFDVLYYVSEKENPSLNEVKWKSILVRVGPDRYREIFHLENSFSTISIQASQIVQTGPERVLVTMDPDGGNGGGCIEGYWWFDRSGPHPLDFSHLRAAIANQVPKNSNFGISCSYLNLESQRVQSWVQKAAAQCHACDFLGQVTAQFRLEGAMLEPVAVSFKSGEP